jgi:hypothetical protein
MHNSNENENKTNYSSSSHLTEKMLELYNKENKNHNQPYVSKNIYNQKPSHQHLKFFCSKCGKSFKIKKNLEEHLLEQKTPCNIVYDENFIFYNAMQNLSNSYNHLYAIYYNSDIPFSERERIRKSTVDSARYCFKLAKNTNQTVDVLKCIKRLEMNSFNADFSDDAIDNVII